MVHRCSSAATLELIAKYGSIAFGAERVTKAAPSVHLIASPRFRAS
jgi:hypothetical protein